MKTEVVAAAGMTSDQTYVGIVEENAGTAVSFTVEADGRDMSYQWYCLMPGSDEWAPLSASSATKPTLKEIQ